METKKILTINLGSTSTKIAYYENDQQVSEKSYRYSKEELEDHGDIWNQLTVRKKTINDFVKENGISLEEIDAFVSRGGHTEPIEGGTYLINDDMITQNRSGKYGIHPTNLGLQIAYDFSKQYHKAIALTCDTPVSDEMEPLARYSGLKEISRKCQFQFLNQKAMADYYAKSIGKSYEDLNLIVVMMGGGISVAAHKKGKVIDGPNGLDGEGPFSNNRSGYIPLRPIIEMCYSGQFSKEEMLYHINGEAGLKSYLGRDDIINLVEEAKQGNKEIAEVLEAMCYQSAKEIGSYATVLYGDVDAILLIGGMANSTYLTDLIRQRVSYIAPVVVLPGEREMERLSLNAYHVLTGEIHAKYFIPKEKTNV